MPQDRTNSAVRALVEARRDSTVPVHAQLEEALRSAVRGGQLPAGTRLPATRQLADDLGVSRGVVVEAYEQLVAEGYLTSRTGSATRVAATAAAPLTSSAGALVAQTQLTAPFDFRPGAPDVRTFPRAAWTKAVQGAIRTVPSGELGYGDPDGHPAARATIASWLVRTRAAVAAPRELVLTTGLTQGLALACRVLRDRGLRELAVEDPGHPDQREMILRNGLVPRPVPVDADGIVVDVLEASGARAVLTTPAHQFPAGVVMGPRRRAALLAWARDRDGIVFEDDYDAEYRYDRAPVGCLQGLAPDVVIYGGSASKMLAPALRLGWLLVPSRLTAEFVAGKSAADHGSPALDQLAFAELIDSGGLDRHLRRTRSGYRARRDALVDALAGHLPDATVRGIAAGLHAVVEVDSDVDEHATEEHARKLGVAVHGMHRYRVHRTGAPAFAIGYSRLPARSIAPGIARLAVALAGARADG